MRSPSCRDRLRRRSMSRLLSRGVMSRLYPVGRLNPGPHRRDLYRWPGRSEKAPEQLKKQGE
jgi:hypothetical protein